MHPVVKMIENRKQVQKIFHYCMRRGVPFTAKCEELISIEMKLSLVAIDRVDVRCRSYMEDQVARQLCLLMKLESSSLNYHLH